MGVTVEPAPSELCLHDTVGSGSQPPFTKPSFLLCTCRSPRFCFLLLSCTWGQWVKVMHLRMHQGRWCQVEQPAWTWCNLTEVERSVLSYRQGTRWLLIQILLLGIVLSSSDYICLKSASEF